MPEYDVFISYSSHDRDRAGMFAAALERAGLRVWWDARIDRGRWDEEIANALTASANVILLLSKSSMQSGNVFAEARRAADAGKLIPVWIERVPPTYAFEGLTALIQQYFLVGSLEPSESEFVRLCAVCGSSSRPVTRPVSSDADEVSDWFSASPTRDDVALCLSVATLENAAFAAVEEAARLLARLLPPEKLAEHEAKPFALRHRNRQLAAIQAECFIVPHGRWESVDYECVRFTCPDRAIDVLRYAWRELGSIQEALCQWLAELAASTSRPLRIRTGVAVGKLAQQHYPVIFERLVRPWALDDEADRRETADIALSIAGFHPGVRGATAEMLALWTNPQAVLSQRRAAAEFLTGYTGALYPEMTVPLLRSLVRNTTRRDELVAVVDFVRAAILRLFDVAAADPDTSLLSVPGMLSGLAGWISEPDPSESPDIGIHFFLFAVSMLPLLGRHEADRLCLDALMKDGSARHSCLIGFGAALDRPAMQPAVREIVNGWAREASTTFTDCAALDELRNGLLAAAQTTRARDRIMHVFRTIRPVNAGAPIVVWSP